MAFRQRHAETLWEERYLLTLNDTDFKDVVLDVTHMGWNYFIKKKNTCCLHRNQGNFLITRKVQLCYCDDLFLKQVTISAKISKKCDRSYSTTDNAEMIDFFPVNSTKTSCKLAQSDLNSLTEGKIHLN